MLVDFLITLGLHRSGSDNVEVGNATECSAADANVASNVKTTDGVVPTETVLIPDYAEVDMGEDADRTHRIGGESNDVDMEVDNGKLPGDDDAVFISDDQIIFLALSVDNLFCFGADIERIMGIQTALASRFKMTDLGEFSHYLDTKVDKAGKVLA